MDIQLLQKESGGGRSVIQTTGTSSKLVVIMNINVAILTEFSAIWVKKGQKGKKREKETARRKKGREVQKATTASGCYIDYFGQNVSTEELY